MPHVELGEIQQRGYIGHREKASTAEFCNQVSTMSLLPAQEHGKTSEFVADRIDGRTRIPELGGCE